MKFGPEMIFQKKLENEHFLRNWQELIKKIAFKTALRVCCQKSGSSGKKIITVRRIS